MSKISSGNEEKEMRIPVKTPSSLFSIMYLLYITP